MSHQKIIPTAIIVDDERRSRRSLKKALEMTSMINTVGLAANIDEAVGLIKKYNPDVVFLDVRMPGESGFDLLEKIENINFQIIFTTAFDEYALAALKCGALDYLLKPISIEELNISINKILQTFQKEEVNQNIDNLLEWVKFNNMSSGKIPIADLHGIKFVNAKSIIRCSADNNYTGIFRSNRP